MSNKSITVRLRAGDGAIFLRQAGILGPLIIGGVLAGIGALILSESLGMGIAVLNVGVIGAFILGIPAAKNFDHSMDKNGPAVVLQGGELIVPMADGTQRIKLDEATLQTGWHNSRSYSSATGGINDSRGIFLLVQWPGGKVLIHGADDTKGAAELSLTEYKSSPTNYEQVIVWTRDIVPLLRELDVRD